MIRLRDENSITVFLVAFVLIGIGFRANNRPSKTVKEFRKNETSEITGSLKIPQIPVTPQTPETFAVPPAPLINNPRGTRAPKGWVYIATMENTAGVVKIGYSERDPRRRIEEWATTGQPGQGHLAYAVLVEEPKNFERRVHRRLSEFRTRGERFKCNLDTVVTAIQESGTILYVEDWRT